MRFAGRPPFPSRLTCSAATFAGRVVKKFVIPMTASRRCRFVELETEVPPEAVGHVDTFMSHCWGGSFGDLVNAARHNSRPGRRVWIDLFVSMRKRQHAQNDTVSRQRWQCLSSLKARCDVMPRRSISTRRSSSSVARSRCRRSAIWTSSSG